MWYNSKTNELQSHPPNGNTWIHPDLFLELYPDWVQVNDTFVPPVKKPTKDQQLFQLDLQYQPQFKELAESLGIASLANNQSLIQELQQEYASLKSEYGNKREVIING